jgi:hypothetical protein
LSNSVIDSIGRVLIDIADIDLRGQNYDTKIAVIIIGHLLVREQFVPQIPRLAKIDRIQIMIFLLAIRNVKVQRSITFQRQPVYSFLSKV